MKKFLSTIVLASLFATSALAESFIAEDSDYEDTLTFLISSIEDKGLTVSSRNHVGAMLDRTAYEVEADTRMYENADVLSFCSAELSYLSMKADIEAIQYCPYNIYLYKAVGSNDVVLGFRDFPEVEELQAVEQLLREIIINTIE